jgi:putative acetyltransferase
MVAEQGASLVGFVTVDPKSGYLDQIVVAPEAWGSDVADGLMEEARRISPRGLELKVNADNARAIRFYAKQGFVDAGETVNEISGAPVRLMRWRP